MKVRVCTEFRVEGIGGIGFTWLPEHCITYLLKNLCKEIMIRMLNQAGSIQGFRVQGIAAFYSESSHGVQASGFGVQGLGVYQAVCKGFLSHISVVHNLHQDVF